MYVLLDIYCTIESIYDATSHAYSKLNEALEVIAASTPALYYRQTISTYAFSVSL